MRNQASTSLVTFSVAMSFGRSNTIGELVKCPDHLNRETCSSTLVIFRNSSYLGGVKMLLLDWLTYDGHAAVVVIYKNRQTGSIGDFEPNDKSHGVIPSLHTRQSQSRHQA